ncbi:hypothetical protein IFT68_09675 [Oxalobacteraceae sp. CFBP 13730]|nr:hypothetical protein [Oxalobacteraceae sp. CFBP 13730]
MAPHHSHADAPGRFPMVWAGTIVVARGNVTIDRSMPRAAGSRGLITQAIGWQCFPLLISHRQPADEYCFGEILRIRVMESLRQHNLYKFHAFQTGIFAPDRCDEPICHRRSLCRHFGVQCVINALIN